jgi:5-methylcytosine-specific restriction endonuclease McrA
MDHRVPVVEGGGSCGLENLRTLCWACHRRETAELAKRRARERRANKPLPLLEAIERKDENATR